MNPWSKLRALFRKPSLEADMAEEMRAHLEMQAAENEKRGMSAEEARYAAQRGFGHVDGVKEQARDQWGFLWLEQFGQDLRQGFRTLRKNPAFTLVSVATLALGIGANTALFSIIDGLLLKPLPYADADRLVQVWQSDGSGKGVVVAPGDFLDWKTQSRSFEGVAAFFEGDFVLAGNGEPEQIRGVRMSASGLGLLRATPLLGRNFAPDEDQPGRGRVVVLTERMWRNRFGSDPGMVGRAIRLSGESYTVIGVLPPRFLPWDRPEFIIPFVFTSDDANEHGSHYLKVFGCLNRGTTLTQAGAELDALSRRSWEANGMRDKFPGVKLVPLQDELTGGVRPILLILLGATGVVLLIACSNVANLLLAKASSRQREIAVRVAIGASRGRIIRQLLTESLLLSVLGALAGLAVAFWGSGLLVRLAAARIPQVQAIGLHAGILGFALGMGVLTGLVFGLVPALRVSRPDLAGGVKGGTRGSSGGENRMRSALIVTEVGGAMVLLVGAGLLLNSFIRLSSVSPGFEVRNLLTLGVTLPEAKYPDDARRALFYEQVVDRIEALPGVERVGLAGSLPMTGGSTVVDFTILGRTNPPPVTQLVTIDFCTPDYFRTLGVALRRGRLFARQDLGARSRTAVVNEAFVREYFPGEEPVGRSIHCLDEDWVIIGVVGDIHQRGLAEPAGPIFYWPVGFAPGKSALIAVRTKLPLLALAQDVRRAVQEVDPQQPVSNVHTMEEVVAGSMAGRRVIMMLLGFFAATALVLAAIGLYGVIAYAVVQRTREIGIRLALGASRGNVLGLVLGQGLKLTTVGVIIGGAGACGATRVLASQLYETTPVDPLTFAIVALGLFLVAVLASLLPAGRATRVDPVVALRAE